MDVEKLRELERRATPGPWEPFEGSILFGGERGCDEVICLDYKSSYAGCDYWIECSPEDRALIVALRNAAPEILEKLARLEKLERVAEATRSRVDAVLPSEERLAHEQLRTALADLDGGKG